MYDRFRMRSRHWVDDNPPRNGLRYILFNEAQDSYWDEELWSGLIKSTAGGTTRNCIVLFCYFGSLSGRPTAFESNTTSPTLILNARISLRPTAADPDLYLLLDRSEYDDVIARRQRPVHLDEDLKSATFSWTAGHVGAVTVFLEFLSLRVRATPYTDYSRCH